MSKLLNVRRFDSDGIKVTEISLKSDRDPRYEIEISYPLKDIVITQLKENYACELEVFMENTEGYLAGYKEYPESVLRYGIETKSEMEEVLTELKRLDEKSVIVFEFNANNWIDVVFECCRNKMAEALSAGVKPIITERKDGSEDKLHLDILRKDIKWFRDEILKAKERLQVDQEYKEEEEYNSGMQVLGALYWGLAHLYETEGNN